MIVEKLANGQVEIVATESERYIIAQCLNECCNGFKLADFEARIGAGRPHVEELLDKLTAMYPSRVGQDE